ncbi:hypothetical protein CPB84DRAFT_711138 [Gymnopilus junonius]|uniref:Uncharacterized protein n=1 Tax=Gymnopilus junonius TaxID=109634 RepID=A0A9P5NSL9_GYMJU|nr:hypothetical protein CPB84DRAFT_711138 [Gymnopilus junonius]
MHHPSSPMHHAVGGGAGGVMSSPNPFGQTLSQNQNLRQHQGQHQMQGYPGHFQLPAHPQHPHGHGHGHQHRLQGSGSGSTGSGSISAPHSAPESIAFQIYTGPTVLPGNGGGGGGGGNGGVPGLTLGPAGLPLDEHHSQMQMQRRMSLSGHRQGSHSVTASPIPLGHLVGGGGGGMYPSIRCICYTNTHTSINITCRSWIRIFHL